MKEIKITLRILGQDIILVKHSTDLYSVLREISDDLGKSILDILNFITDIKTSEIQ